MSKKLHTEDKDNKAKKVQRQEKTKGQQKSADGGARGPHQNLDVATLTHMQQTVGNQAVQAMLAQRSAGLGRKSGQGPTEVDESVADAIKSEKGKGGQLEEGISNKAGSVMGSDFSDVKVHTDSKADSISREIGAKAFTTGNDIFFREGEYNPSSSEGQHLISHELTHVVQQGSGGSNKPAGVQGKMTVNDPNDKYEVEADKVADAVMSSKQQEAGVQRAEEEEEVQAKHELQRNPDEEMEEEDVQMMEDEEEVQAKEIQRNPDEEMEEEDVQMMEDEEEVQAKEELQRSEEEEEA